MKNPVDVVGIGEMGSVFARGVLRLGYPVYPVVRGMDMADMAAQVEPELVELQHVLRELEITREQLVIIGILVGTDFNPDGIKGIGPKRALALVKKFKTLPNVIKQFDASLFPVDPTEINDIFLQPPIQRDIALQWT